MTRPAQRRDATVSARFVWILIAVLAVTGAAIVAGLAWLWRTGRVAGVDSTDIGSSGRIVALAGVIPSGGAAPLQAPRSISGDGSRVYVTEPDAGRITVFTESGRFLRRIEVEDLGRVYPVDAVAVGDTLYVVDTAGKRLLAMSADGTDARRVASGLVQPTAIAAQGDRLVIADAGSGLWALDAPDGEPERIAGPDATRGFAGGIAVRGDRVFLTDAAGSRVLEVAVASGEMRAFGERVNLPRGLAIDGAGRTWVADVFGGTVLAFDSGGALLGDIEDEPIAGPEPPSVQSPQGIAYTPANGRLWVVDSGVGRVLVYAVSE